MAQVAGPQGPAQHLAATAASAFARAQSPGKHLAVHAPELAVKPHLQILRRYRRPLLLCLEYADRPTLENHVHCSARVGNRASVAVRIGMSRREGQEIDRREETKIRCTERQIGRELVGDQRVNSSEQICKVKSDGERQQHANSWPPLLRQIPAWPPRLLS